MSVGSRDSYLKSLPAVGPFLDRVARYRLKGFHREERTGDGNELDVVATYPILPPWGLGTPKWTRDTTANDSDKSFTVPAGKIWDMKAIYVYFSTTATVGNRVLRLRIKSNGTDVDWEFVGTNHAASNNVRYGWSLDGGNAPTASGIVGSTGPTILLAGAVLQLVDTAAIDAAADDMVVVLHYVEYDAS